jgi:cytochrome b pre-mRNA-processing protein 3
MIFHLFRRAPRSDIIAAFYGTIVAQARRPVFYQSYAVPDTVDGRFEMIALHLVLILCRLEREPGEGRRLGQGLFDAFCRDMDASMREMGVGDLAVPRKMRRIGEAFYGRLAAYRQALATQDDAELAAALNRNVFAGAAPVLGAERLAIYMRAAASAVADQDNETFLRGRLDFPDPENIVPAVGA